MALNTSTKAEPIRITFTDNMSKAHRNLYLYLHDYDSNSYIGCQMSTHGVELSFTNGNQIHSALIHPNLLFWIMRVMISSDRLVDFERSHINTKNVPHWIWAQHRTSDWNHLIGQTE